MVLIHSLWFKRRWEMGQCFKASTLKDGICWFDVWIPDLALTPWNRYFTASWETSESKCSCSCFLLNLVLPLGHDVDDWVDPDRGPVEHVGDRVHCGVQVAFVKDLVMNNHHFQYVEEMCGDGANWYSLKVNAALPFWQWSRACRWWRRQRGSLPASSETSGESHWHCTSRRMSCQNESIPKIIK